MKIIVNHLTRMRPGFICVAGRQTDTMQHVRPVLQGRSLGVNMLKSRGGLFDIASAVVLGKTVHVGKPPEVEDYVFHPRDTNYVRQLSDDEFWKLLRETAKKKLRDIFGNDLQSHGNGCAIDEGAGSASLGCLIPKGKPLPRVDPYGKIRMLITDGVMTADLSVTDLRLVQDDHKTPRRKMIENVRQRIRNGVALVLSVGLARPWLKPGDNRRRHWLQINNIHLADNPGWPAA